MKRIIIIILACVALLAAGWMYKMMFKNNVSAGIDKTYLLIPANRGFDDVLSQIREKKLLRDETSFIWLAKFMKYDKDTVPGGRYLIKEGMSNRSIITKLRSGLQNPLNLTFNNVRTIPELAGKLSKDIEADSITLLTYFLSRENLNTCGLDSQTLLTLFIPNTYEVKWNITPERLISRMKSECDRFWNSDSRKTKLEKLNMTKEEVYTLASIVEKESNVKAERPAVAGVYLNRLKTGMKLQADPTVVFATGDFELRRVLYSHLMLDSPYNTYKYEGLPPGPIYMPSVNSIDAVLNAENHEYVFFCAKPGYNSGHLFSETLQEHCRNADTYQEWLAKEGIK